MEINTIRLRCMLGWSGITLPWILCLLLGYIPQSISITYYTQQAGPVFVMVMGAAAFLLVSYKGYDIVDDIVNTFAGLAGLGVCLFPTWHNELAVGTFQLNPDLSYRIHNACALAFFLLLIFNSMFLFTKHGAVMTENKKKRNVIYIICGLGMAAAFGLFLLPRFAIRLWLAETIVLTFFGISFLTKANCYKWLFADPKGKWLS